MSPSAASLRRNANWRRMKPSGRANEDAIVTLRTWGAWSSAISCAMAPPVDEPTIWAGPMSRCAINEAMSAACCAMV